MMGVDVRYDEDTAVFTLPQSRFYVSRGGTEKALLAEAGLMRFFSSIEVEIALNRHPAVLLSAVVARPDEKWGETPCAFVQLRPDGQASADELIAFCRDNLPHFAVPKTVVFDNLPTTSTGKVQKYTLRERARAL